MWIVRAVPLFSQTDRPVPPTGRPVLELWLTVGLLVGVVALGVWLFVRLKQWRQESTDEMLPSPQEQLDHYQQMVDDGLLDPDEFARIKDHMNKQSLPPNPDEEP